MASAPWSQARVRGPARDRPSPSRDTTPAAVAVNDFVVERAEAVAAEIESLGVRAVAVQADVG